MKYIISALIIAVSFTAQASEIKKADYKVCNELKDEAKKNFKQINHNTYQHNGKVIEYVCGSFNKMGQIAVYSEKEYADIINNIKQMRLEREQQERQKKENEMNKIRSLYK
jgi:hypothetical protein